jgi:hypothetical protein
MIAPKIAATAQANGRGRAKASWIVGWIIQEGIVARQRFRCLLIFSLSVSERTVVRDLADDNSFAQERRECLISIVLR